MGAGSGAVPRRVNLRVAESMANFVTGNGTVLSATKSRVPSGANAIGMLLGDGPLPDTVTMSIGDNAPLSVSRSKQ
jgi:hypothetical protein